MIALAFVLISCSALISSPSSTTPTTAPTPPPAVLNTPVAVATGQMKTWGVAVDDANVYWTDCGTNPAAQDGRVMKMSKSTGEIVALASKQSCPTTIALDATYVYWIGGVSSARTISRIAQSGGAPSVLTSAVDMRALVVDAAALYWSWCDASNNYNVVIKMLKQDDVVGAAAKIAVTTGCANDLALDANNIYWIDSVGVMKIDKNGGAATLVTSARFHPRNLIADENNLYWIADNYIMRLPKSGGAPNALVASQNDLQSIAVDSSNLYWIDGKAVRRIAKTGGTQFTLANVNGSAPWLAVDKAYVYWTTYGDTVMRVAKAGGVAVAQSNAEPQTLAFAQEGLNALAVDDTNIYWTTCRYEKEKYDHGTVMQAPKTGGDAIALATNQSCPGNLVLDANNVYWVNQGAETSPNDYQDGAIMRVAKSGGAPTTLAVQQAGRALLAVDDANIFWTICGKNPGIMRMAKDGSGMTQVASERDCPSSIALDATNIYWSGGDAIKKMDKRGGATQTIATSGGSALVVDEASVDWTRTEQTSRTTFHSCADEASALMQAPKNGGAPVRLAPIPGLAPTHIASDDTYIYYATDCTQGILRVAKTGGAPSVVVANVAPAQLAIDASNIFWSVYSNGTILRVSKPK